jgi:Sulfotransferase family
MKTQEGHQSTGLITPSEIPADQRHHLREYRSWKRFHHGPRKLAKPLLRGLSRYGNCVLVAGCQRSGTTMLTRVIAGSRGFQRFRLTHDDELDAALILAGYVNVPNDRRYCFQTTYLNERYLEYATMGPDQRLIWVLRNPYSVVRSMLYNWKRFALNELYESCGVSRAISGRQRLAKLQWPLGPSRVERACLSYSAKTAQILAIRELLRVDQLLVVDYDAMVRSTTQSLARIFAVIGESFDALYSSSVHTASVHKADRTSDRVRQMIDEICLPTYRECLALASAGAGS